MKLAEQLHKGKLNDILSSFLKDLLNEKKYQKINKINKVHNNMNNQNTAPIENTVKEDANMFNADKYSLKINLPLVEPPMELLQLVSTMLVETFNSYDLNLLDQSFEENNTLC
ncbi:hypothetical protein DAPK24_053110 [Pichia kluyveri]|uniref:Uncharacterized protein n=1 Tax=Pichia kluyveri TaxID=36015 RepID=A0AAV5RBY7_PICKL|nr:hypothetical protein DAPK24_053110 [Pichia kluyveri]